MERIGLPILIVLVIIGMRFFLRSSKMLSWIVGASLFASLAYTTYQGAGVLSQNPIYILYGLLATVIVNAVGVLLLLADKKHKIYPITTHSPLTNPFLRGATLCVLLLLQIHLYAFMLYRFTKRPGETELIIALSLSFFSALLLIDIYRDYFRTSEQQEIKTPSGGEVTS